MQERKERKMRGRRRRKGRGEADRGKEKQVRDIGGETYEK